MPPRPLVLVALGCAVVSLGGRDAHAVGDDARLSQLDRRVYTVDSGLPQPLIQAIAQAEDRSLWIATGGGLARFDGHGFTVVAPPEDPALARRSVRALLRDRSGTTWIASAGALVRARAGTFETVAGPPIRSVNQIIEDRAGALWIASFDGLYNVHDGQLRAVVRAGDAAWAVCEDAAGVLWIGHVANGVTRVRDGRVEPFALPPPLAGRGVHALAADGAAVWVGSDGRGLARLGDQARVWGTRDGLPDEHVTALLRDRAGTLWIGTQRGLARMVGGELRTFPPGDELAAEPIEALFEDDEDGLWVGTRSAGLMRLSRGRLTAYDEAEGLPSRRVISVAGARDGTVFAGTRGDGLVRFAGGRFTRVTTRDGLCTDELWSLLVDDAGVVWAGGPLAAEHGLCRLRDGHWEPIEPAPASRDGAFLPRVLRQTRDGTMWVGGAGLWRARGTELEPVRAPDEMRDDLIQALEEGAAGELWVGGSLRLRRLQDGRWDAFPPSAGGPPVPIVSLWSDPDGTLWIGTRQGLAVRRGGRFFRFTAAHGVAEDPMYAVREDREGALWLGTSRGLFRVARAGLLAVADGRAARVDVVRYGRADGMKSDQVDGTSGHAVSFTDASGRLWFPTGRGLVAVEPRAPAAARAASPPVIDAVIADGRALSPRSGALIVPPGERTLELRYSRVSLAAAEKLRFRYRLVGFDRGWVDAGARRMAYYTKVPPGRYRFEVMADLPDGPAQPPASLDITLQPWFHETGTSRALIAALLLGGAFAVHRARLARLAGRHRAVLAERARIARDLHDTLAQGFTGIALHLEAAQKRLEAQPARARESLEQAKALANRSLVEARRAVWDLREGARADGGLLAALADTARALGAEVPVRLQIEGKPAPLPEATAEVLVRVGRESVTNALRHAGARELRFTLAFAHGRVELRVEDDGRGFDARAPRPAGHMGLDGMRERVEQLGGTLVIDSVEGRGTAVSVVLPLETA